MAYKIKIILTDENGDDYVGEVTMSALPREVGGRVIKVKQTTTTIKPMKMDLDFDLSIQAFMKKIGAKHLSGPLKATALIAYLSGGNLNVPVKAANARKQWSKMKSILGKYNTFYFTPAKQNAWIHPVQPASYKIRKEGLETLQEKI